MNDKIYRAYKAEIAPTAVQKEKMRQNMGVCRFLYNEYLNMNIRLYKLYMEGVLTEDDDHFISAIDFDKYVNRELKSKKEFAWIGICGSKARKKAIKNAQAAYMNYFKSERRFPNFKSYIKPAVKLYYPRNNVCDWTISRNCIKIPTFGKVRLKQYGYLPLNADVVSGTVSFYGGRYFVSVLAREKVRAIRLSDMKLHVRFDEQYFIRCEGISGCNIEELASVRKLKKTLHREKQSLKRKLTNRNYSRNIEKQRLRIEKLHYRLKCIRQDFVKKLVADIISHAPSCIVLEPRQLMAGKEKDSAQAIQMKTLFYVFTRRLIQKARLYGINIIDNV